MNLARHHNAQLIQRGDMFTIAYKTGSITVTSRDKANRIFNSLKGK